MNDRSIIEAGGPGNRPVWVDGYLPVPHEQLSATAPLIDTAWLRGALYRQRWLVGVTLASALIVGLIVTLLATPVYQASATIRVTPFGNNIVEGTEATSPISTAQEIGEYMQTQQVVIESRNLAQVVAEDLDLGTRSALLGSDIDDLRPPGQSDEQWNAQKLRMAVGALQDGVSAEVPGNTQIVTLRFNSTDPVLAAEIANGYADAYVQSDTRRNIESNTYAREYLREQIAQARDRLDEAEKAANAYARTAGIVTADTVGIDGDTGQTITGANLSSINQTVAQARAARIAAEQKWRSVSAIPARQLPEVISNLTVQRLTEQKAVLNGELANLRERYTDQFPEIIDVKARIARIDEQIGATASDIKASIRNEYVIARNQEAALTSELGSVTDDALSEQDQKIQYNLLEREAEALRVQLTSLLDRFNAISTAANVQTGALTLLDSAIVPTGPISPSLPRNMLLALVIGAALAGGLALMREIFVDQFRRGEEIEERLGATLLGITPFVKLSDIESSGANQFSSLMEAYASIRSSIDFTVPRDGAVVQMTSSQGSEGKSTTSLILAELFARLGRKTLLVDADLRNPSIVKLLDAEKPEFGLAEVVMGHASIEDAVFKGVHDNLEILAVAGVPANPVELLSSQRFREFIEERRQEYSMIIVDSSPVLGLADAPEIAKNADATVFVIEANRTTYAQARTALKRLSTIGGTVIGGILTKYRALEAGADYNYQYRYYSYGREDADA